MNTISLALELLANIYTQDVDTIIQDDGLDQYLLAPIFELNILGKLITYGTQALAPITSPSGESIQLLVNMVQGRALGALNNIILLNVLDEWVETKLSEVHQCCDLLFTTGQRQSTCIIPDLDFMDAILTTLWSLLRALPEPWSVNCFDVARS